MRCERYLDLKTTGVSVLSSAGFWYGDSGMFRSLVFLCSGANTIISLS